MPLLKVIYEQIKSWEKLLISILGTHQLWIFLLQESWNSTNETLLTLFYHTFVILYVQIQSVYSLSP